MSPIIKTLSRLAVTLAALLLTACGGGGNGIGSQRDPGAALARYTVGGAVSGLTGSLVLQNNGRDNITVAADGNFTFTEKFSSGSTYAVSVLTQPTGQTCSVSTGAGTVSGNNVSNVAVICSTNAYTVGGTVSGLTGTVVLQNNNGDNLSITANGAYTFATKVALGSPYAVTVLTHPTGQSCSIANGTGTINANIGNVTITCAANTYIVGGVTSGLIGSMVLQNNGADDLTVATNGAFTFPAAVGYNTPYNVTQLSLQFPRQNCVISNGSGTVTGNVSNVAVACTTNSYTVGGTVSGLTGGTIVLQNNGGDDITVSANGNFTFAGNVNDYGSYAVTVLTQPANQTCSVSAGAGTVSGNNIGNVAVICSTNAYTVGGTVSGLSGSVVLQNNGGDNLTVSANGNFTFATSIADNGTYVVTVLTQPVGQTCSVSSGAGTVSGGNVTSVVLVCATNIFEVVVDAGATSGGTWSGANPDIFTPNAPVATVSVTDIQSRLNAGIPVTISTSPAALGNGDIFVNSAVTWAANKLTLRAHHNIAINANLNGSGTAGLALEYGQGAVAAGNSATYNVNAPVNLASTGSFSTKLGSDGAVTNYTIITTLGAFDSVTGTDLQGMTGNKAGNYVLGANIDASATSGWNDNGAGGFYGFAPVGTTSVGQAFTGGFDGLGHTVSNLYINRPATASIGLFGFAGTVTLSNVGLLNANVTGKSSVGTLLGSSATGIVNNSYATGTVSGVGAVISYVGGLVGGALTINDSHAAVTVSSSGQTVGGLAGSVHHINRSYATGSVSGTNQVGGLAGFGLDVTDSYATGNVSGTGVRVGGLVGWQSLGSISNSYATGSVGGTSDVGGLVGFSDQSGASIATSYASGAVTGTGNRVGGLAGSYWGTIANSYATGSASGASNVGGLVGELDGANGAGTITNSYATGAVSASVANAGGLLGLLSNGASVTTSYWDTVTTGQAASAGGAGAVGKTTAEMKTQATFSGWDFVGKWQIVEGVSYPTLR